MLRFGVLEWVLEVLDDFMFTYVSHLWWVLIVWMVHLLNLRWVWFLDSLRLSKERQWGQMLVQLLRIMFIYKRDKHMLWYYISFKHRVECYVCKLMLSQHFKPEQVCELNIMPITLVVLVHFVGSLQDQLSQVVNIRLVNRCLRQVFVEKVWSVCLLLNWSFQYSLIMFIMVIRALNPSWALPIALNVRARSCLVKKRVVFFLLPTVAVFTVAHLLTSLVVLGDKGTWSPVWAYCNTVIIKHSRVSSKVLVVVGVWTLGFVVFFVKGTPLCFIVKHKEILIFFHLMN